MTLSSPAGPPAANAGPPSPSVPVPMWAQALVWVPVVSTPQVRVRLPVSLSVLVDRPRVARALARHHPPQRPRGAGPGTGPAPAAATWSSGAGPRVASATLRSRPVPPVPPWPRGPPAPARAATGPAPIAQSRFSRAAARAGGAGPAGRPRGPRAARRAMWYARVTGGAPSATTCSLRGTSGAAAAGGRARSGWAAAWGWPPRRTGAPRPWMGLPGRCAGLASSVRPLEAGPHTPVAALCCGLWYAPLSLCKHGDPVFPHFWAFFWNHHFCGSNPNRGWVFHCSALRFEHEPNCFMASVRPWGARCLRARPKP